MPDAACVVHRVCNASYWVGLSAEWEQACSIAWPSDVETACATEGGRVALSATDRAKSDEAYDLIALAIAAFEASPESNAFTSKFDSNFKGKSGLTQEERRGFALFKGQAKCARCHTVTAAGAKSLFTDFTFDNLGFPKNPENPVYLKNPAFVDRGLGGFLATQPEYAALASANDGKHKVPTLRNVDKRPSAAFVKAYGHNGYFKSLKGIVHFYNTRDVKPVCPGDYTEAQALAAHCWPAPEVAASVNTAELGNLGLSDQDEDAIVAFLRTLSDGYESSAP
ncbi:MAG TPA: c-type cytochrome [Candidatus Competibacter sp.]|nr:c-type cytochrome [Candidatus Competibacter sp.]